MAYRLERERTNTTPYILIDEEKNYMRFEGESYLEDVIGFFKEIDEWLTGYLASDFTEFTFECAMEYFNSSTTKLLYNFLVMMDKNATAGKTVTVNWIALEDNEIMIECGEDFQEEMERLTFNIVIAD
ncbi:MAG: DUF1987 domain-containing protein [Defluviitaleaceae bacterium]|nr:DUF1987 domain-containing protein [Defluviitaleaceae bacterium]MCL2239799.1 DUF1987 domain-containing protein [Defluviitaleaceae bacterium]